MMVFGKHGGAAMAWLRALVVLALLYAPLKVAINSLGPNHVVTFFIWGASLVLFLAGMMLFLTGSSRFSNRREWAELSVAETSAGRRLTALGWLLAAVPLATSVMVPDLGLRNVAFVLAYVYLTYAMAAGATGRYLQVMVTSRVEPARHPARTRRGWVLASVALVALLGLNGCSFGQRITLGEAQAALTSYRDAIPADIMAGERTDAAAKALDSMSGTVATAEFVESYNRDASQEEPVGALLGRDRTAITEALALPPSGQATDFNAFRALVAVPNDRTGRTDMLFVAFARRQGRWLISEIAWD